MSPLSADEIWVVATCAVCAFACAIPGVFLILSRSSLLADGISHSALAGIGTAFLLSHSRSPLFMLTGALTAGLLTAWLTSAITKARVIKPDAALGVVFTTLFAIGVIIISSVAREVDLDPGCVLYGLPEFIPFDTITLLSIEVPRAFLWLFGVFVINTLLCGLFWKELTISTFDKQLARALGFYPTRVHYGLLTCVAVTIVLSFEALGSIVVISMLITPAAAAYIISDKLIRIIALACVLGGLSAIVGFYGALAVNSSVAGMMSVSAGIFFIAALCFAPHRGIVPLFLSQTILSYRIVRDDILGLLFRWHEATIQQPIPPLTKHTLVEEINRPLVIKLALFSLSIRGDILAAPDGSLRLSERGLVEAKALIRSHRLWEAYLAKHLPLPMDHLHAPSERTEHFIGRALARDIAEEIESQKDPHGKIIP